MSVLSVNNLKMSFVERLLFENISFEVESRDKIGLIGANGVGKTTLFKILCGKISPDSGGVSAAKGIKIGYMEQHACPDSECSIINQLLKVFSYLTDIEKELEKITPAIESGSENIEKLILRQAYLQEEYQNKGGLTYKSRAASALMGLGFKEQDFNTPVGKLSGGQRAKLSLASLLLSDCQILLLDEPTNHLDIASVRWLEGFVKDFKGAAIIVSHDRYFLDAVTNKTIEIEHKRSRMYTGGYSVFLNKKEKILEDERKKYKNDIKEIKRIEGIVEQQKRWGQERNFITAASKQKQIDRLKEQLASPDRDEDTLKMKLEPMRVSGNDVLICNGLEKSFGEKHLFKNVNLHLRKGERVFILGANGCGKTTLFKILKGEIMPDKGDIVRGVMVDMGYFDQMQGNLNLNNSALDEIWDEYPDMTQTRVRTALGTFLFKGDDVFKPLYEMSGGERARISLLKLMLKGPNLLLLDEPTNHLDTSSREELEKNLKNYGGTMLIISHDRYFINKLADRILLLTPDGFKEYLGNYDYFIEKSGDKEEKQQVKEQKTEKSGANLYKQQKELQSRLRKLNTAVKKCEESIEKTEKEISSVEETLSSTEIISDYNKILELTQELDKLKNSLSEQYDCWEKLQQDLLSAESDSLTVSQ